MRNSNRNAKTLAALAAATALVSSVQLASAQTWATTDGNWSQGANWVGSAAPASAVTTQVFFNANGATYTATQDIANPFVLNRITFNNTGAGVINVGGGNGISFGGTTPGIVQSGSGAVAIANPLTLPTAGADQDATSITGSGAGAVSLTGALNSSVNSTATAGAFLDVNTPNSTTNLSGGTGANGLYALKLSQGNMNITGGTWNLRSTERNSDALTLANTGLWSLDVGGQAGAGITRFQMSGGVMNAEQGFISIQNTSIATFSNSAAATFNTNNAAAQGRFGIMKGTGTISIETGAQVACRLFEVGRGSSTITLNNNNAFVRIDGPGSRMMTTQVVAARSGNGTIVVSNGGNLDVTTIPVANSNLVFIGSGGDNQTPAAPVSSDGRVTITGANSRMTASQLSVSGALGRGTFELLNGGTTSVTTSFIGSSNTGAGTVLISGAGSTFTQTTTYVTSGGSQNAALDALRGGVSNTFVQAGASMQAQALNLTQNHGGFSNFTIDAATVNSTGVGAGTGSWFMSNNLGKLTDGGGTPATTNLTLQNNATGSAPANIVIAGQITNFEINSGGGRGTINVLSGSTLTAGNAFLLAATAQSAGTLNVNAGSFAIGGQLTFSGDISASTVSVSNGGVVRTTNAATAGFIASDLGGSSLVNLNNGSLTVASTLVVAGGNTDTVGDPLAAGVATINVTNGSRLAAQDYTWGQNNGGVTTLVADGATSLVTSAGIGAGTGSWRMSNNRGTGSPASQVNMTFQNGAQAVIPTTLFMSGGILNGAGGQSTININSGAGMTVGALATMGSDLNSAATLSVNGGRISVGTIATGSGDFIVSSGTNSVARANFLGGGTGTVGRSLFIGLGQNSNGSLTVSGAGSSMAINRALVMSGGATDAVGDPIAGGTASLDVTSGGVVNAQNAFISSGPQGKSTINVVGANSLLNVDAAGAGTSLFVASDDIGATSTINVNTGGRIQVNGSSFTGTVAGAGLTTVNVNGGTWNSTGQLQVGGSGGTLGAASVVNINGGGVVTAQGAATSLAIVYGTSTLNIGAGTSPGTVRVGTLGTFVDGLVNYNAGTFNTAGTLGVAGQVRLSTAARNAAGVPSNKKTLEAGTMEFDTYQNLGTNTAKVTVGVVDLDDNDAIFKNNVVGGNGSFDVAMMIRSGRNNGAWNGAGIVSTAAKNASPQNKTLGTLRGDEFHAAQGAAATFNGRTVANSDTLVKYTYYGDATFDGRITFDDYAKIDSGFNAARTGWFNGDFNYDGVINFDDYGLIDQAFLTQGSTVLSRPGGLAGDTSGKGSIIPAGALLVSADGTRFAAVEGSMTGDLESGADAYKSTSADYMKTGSGQGGAGGSLSAVPEPTTVTVLGVGMLGMLGRRRRSS